MSKMIEHDDGTVEIELNPEQEEKLKLRYFNKYKLEEIESISILNE